MPSRYFPYTRMTESDSVNVDSWFLTSNHQSDGSRKVGADLPKMTEEARAIVFREMRPSESREIEVEYSVPCPYHCGTVLTGAHALGNLRRHLKSQACTTSPRFSNRFPCPIHGCGKAYIRSDALRVHMRKMHGAPPPPTRNVEDEE